MESRRRTAESLNRLLKRYRVRSVSLDQLKQAVAGLDDQQRAELIAFALQLRYADDADHQREIAERLNDRDASHWLTPDQFEERLGGA